MYYLHYKQKLPLSLEKCWAFFSSPTNLKILTPEHLGFEITLPIEENIYPGQVIAYTLRPLWGIPVEWVTEITQVQKPHYFIDEQRLGPYKFWHHEHRFKPIEKGVEIEDKVYYKMPFGPLGQAIHWLSVEGELEGIFAYRKAKMEEIFGPYERT